MHLLANVNDPNNLASGTYGVRLWDAGVCWSEVEPQKGVFDFSKLDQYVNNAHAQGLRPIYVMAMTPMWAARAGATTNYTGGSATPPADGNDWIEFVSTLAMRYGDGIVYEVWNEPNLSLYWTGTMSDLFSMTKMAYQHIKGHAPTATVIGCSWNRLGTSEMDRWLYYGAAQYVDAVSFHPYPHNFQPSDAGTITDNFKAVLAKYGVTKPLWATEVGYDYAGQPWPSLAQQSYMVQQTLSTLKAHGVPLSVWYPWINSSYIGLQPVVTEALSVC